MHRVQITPCYILCRLVPSAARPNKSKYFLKMQKGTRCSLIKLSSSDKLLNSFKVHLAPSSVFLLGRADAWHQPTCYIAFPRPLHIRLWIERRRHSHQSFHLVQQAFHLAEQRRGTRLEVRFWLISGF